MAYEPINWQNEPSTDTPISAANLRHMEDGILSASDTADALFEASTVGRLSAFGVAATAVEAFVGEIGRYDIRSALLPGETLARDKSANISTIFQRAHDNAAAIALATGVPQQIWVPAGSYRIDAFLIPRTKVGIKGAGRGQTVFYPQGTQAFIRGGFQETPVPTEPLLVDNVFEDFTVNCYDQADTGYNAAVKAFYMQNTLRSKFYRINCVGSWASQFGNDFMVDAEHVDCYSKDSGRGGPPDAFGTGSGFAVGTGRFENESYSYVNCTVEGSKGAGYFFERLDTRGATFSTPSIFINGGIVQDNAVGMNDCGAGGIQARSATFRRNGIAWIVRKGNSSTVGGRDAQITDCLFWANTTDAIQFRGNDQGGGYRILNSQFIANGGAGIRALAGGRFSAGALTVRGNAFLRNRGGGVAIEGLAGILMAPIVEENEFDGNTGIGLQFSASATGATLSRNRFTDQMKTGLQTTGLSVNAATLTGPRVQDNTFVDQPAAMSDLSAYSQTYIGGNAVLTTPTIQTVFSDSFNRADGPLTSTAIGGLPYVTQGSGVASVVSNQAAITGSTTLTRLTVNAGTANGVYRATLAQYAGQHEGGLILRYQDASNELTIASRTSGTDFHYRLLKRIAGAQTQVAVFAAESAPGDVFEITMTGTTIRVLVNGVEQFNGVVTELASATQFGWFTTGTGAAGARLDDISFTTST